MPVAVRKHNSESIPDGDDSGAAGKVAIGGNRHVHANGSHPHPAILPARRTT